MSAKKIAALVISLILLVAVAVVTIWVVINFDNVKVAMSGSELYTKEDVEKSYEDGYGKALSDKEEYDKLINSYRDTIATQNDLVSQLNSEIASIGNSNKDYIKQVESLTEQRTNLEEQITTLNTIKTNNENTITELNAQIVTLSNKVTALQTTLNENKLLIEQLNVQIANLQALNAQLQENNELNLQTITRLNTQINGLNTQISDLTNQMQSNATAVGVLNAKITELQKSISYYEQYIANLESGEQIVVTFEFGGSVYNIQILNKNSTVSVTVPTSTEYVIFNGWTVGGQLIDLENYHFTTNTKVIADVTYKYTVDFSIDGTNFSHQVVVKDSKATPPTNPTKAGYAFDFWTVDGITAVDLSTYQIKQNTTFIAKFTKLYSVSFQYEGNIISTQSVRNGNTAQPAEAVNTTYKVFNGWKVDGVIVNVANYKINADTVFVADITYKYDVKFVADGNSHDTQIVTKNDKPTVPTTPTKEKYKFIGWTIDGTNAVDIASFVVTENTTFTALFVLDQFDVTFKNGNETISSQRIDKDGYAEKPDFNTDTFMGWTIDGTSIVDISTYQITADTTFTAKFGTWTLIFDDNIHMGGTTNSNKINTNINGIKKGDKIKFSTPSITVKDGRFTAGGSFNEYSYTYVGSGGNFEGNEAWGENTYDYYPMPAEMFFTSDKPLETVVGRVSWSENNVMKFSTYCNEDGILTLEWSDKADFYIEDITIWLVYVLR